MILVLLVITSVGGYVFGRKAMRLSNRALSSAWRTLLECVCLSLVFFVFNLLVAFSWILGARVAVRSFVSFYVVSDFSLLALSFFQGVIFELWRWEAARLGRSANL
jgi:hypothetical protein